MTQKRIVLNVKYEPKARYILEMTGINSCSQLFTLLLHHYGDKLVEQLRGGERKQLRNKSR